MKKPKRWYWHNQHGKGLTKKAKSYLSYKLKAYWRKRKRKAPIYRSLIQLDFTSTKKGARYDIFIGSPKKLAKIKIWIYGKKKHPQRELLKVFRNLRHKGKPLTAKLGSAIGKKSIYYKVSYECEKIARKEAKNRNVYNYWFKIRDYTYRGTNTQRTLKRFSE